MYNLLLVDDEPLLRKGIKLLINLQELNIDKVYEAENGYEAIEIVKNNPVDIVLMDINMPKLDGITAGEEIKKYNKNIYVIILTGYDYFEYARASIKAKIDDYILKPVGKKDIEYILQSTIDILEANRKENVVRDLLKNDATRQESISENQQIKLWLDENVFNPDISLNKMAAAIGYNSSYLSVLIKQIYKMPFQDYVNMRRMEKAKLLLLTSELKNFEIAAAVGIDDVNYFIAKFKKYFSVTPKQYRQGIVNEENI